MSPRQTTLGWIVWAVAAIGMIWFFLHEASGATRKPAAVERGAGARALLKGIRQPGLPPVPSLVVAPATNKTYFFAATATDNRGIESDFSSEVSTTNRPPVALAWTPGAGTNVITNFTVYRGTSSGAYTRSWPAGTNCVLSVPPPAPTNQVITVSGYPPLTNPTAPMMLFTGRSLTISKRYQY